MGIYKLQISFSMRHAILFLIAVFACTLAAKERVLGDKCCSSGKGCPCGFENQASICYSPCGKGFVGRGILCWKGTQTQSRTISRCRRNLAAVKVKTVVKIKKKNRRLGCKGGCQQGFVKQAGLCYTPCPKGFVGRGILCWKGTTSSSRTMSNPC